MPVGPFAFDGQTLGGLTAPAAHDDYSGEPWPHGDRPPPDLWDHRIRPSAQAVGGSTRITLDVATERGFDR
jgi:hypothetical protein